MANVIQHVLGVSARNKTSIKYTFVVVRINGKNSELIVVIFIASLSG